MAISSQSKFTVVSTFSGAGGSSLGYKNAGGRILLAVEIENNAAATYRLNFPDTPIHKGDIGALKVEDVLKRTNLKAGELDILDGSPPCQGFSMVGGRKFGDSRNKLFTEFARLLYGLQPRVFVMENVGGMVRGKMRLLFVECLKRLKGCGYRVSARLLNAQYFHVPQFRRRLIFVGVREDIGLEPSHPKAQSRPMPVRRIEIIPNPRMRNSPRTVRLWRQMKQGGSGKDVPETNGTSFGLFRLDPNKPCPTIVKRWTAGSGIMHWDEPRFLSVPELAQVQTFGLAFKWTGTPTDACRLIGNSVPPRMMQAIAEHIRDNILTKKRDKRA